MSRTMHTLEEALFRATTALTQERLGRRPRRLRVVCTGGAELALKVPRVMGPTPGESPPLPLPDDEPRERRFSDLEERILQAMPADDWMSATEIAKKLDQLPAGGQVSGHFRSILTNLMDRNVITSGRAGYKKLIKDI